MSAVPGAEVSALGKDGVHRIRADATGHYRLSLLTGMWTLRAARTAGAAQGPPARVDLAAGQQAEVDLSAAPAPGP